MSELLSEIKNCEECGYKTNELYLTDIGEILCVDCEAEYCRKQNLTVHRDWFITDVEDIEENTND